MAHFITCPAQVALHEVLYFRLQPPGYVLGDGCRGLVL